jgi:hypothetical protein
MVLKRWKTRICKPLWHYQAVRWVRRCKRRVFHSRKLPHWAKDSYDLAEPFIAKAVTECIKVLKLLPTFIAVWLTPRHFFRRLPLILKSEKSMYVTPTKFAFYGIAFGVLMAFAVYPVLPVWKGVVGTLSHCAPTSATEWLSTQGEWAARGILFVFCMLSPVWMIPLSWLLHTTLRFAENSIKGSGLQFQRSRIRAPERIEWAFQIPRTWRRDELVDRKQYSWGLCYFGVSAFLLLHPVMLVAFICHYVFQDTMKEVPPYTFLPPAFLVAFVIPPVLLAKKLIVEPYVELLRAARRIPTREMNLYDVEALRVAVGFLTCELDRLMMYRERVEEKENCLANVARNSEKMHREWVTLKRLWQIQEFDNPNDVRQIRSERRKACLKPLELDRLANMMSDAGLESKLAAYISDTISEIDNALSPIASPQKDRERCFTK